MYPLTCAALNGHSDIVSFILGAMNEKRGKSMKNEGRKLPSSLLASSLHASVLKDHLECTRLLLQHGAPHSTLLGLQWEPGQYEQGGNESLRLVRDFSVRGQCSVARQ